MKDFVDVMGELSDFIRKQRSEAWVSGLNYGIECVQNWMLEKDIPIRGKGDTLPQLFEDIEKHWKPKNVSEEYGD